MDPPSEPPADSPSDASFHSIPQELSEAQLLALKALQDGNPSRYYYRFNKPGEVAKKGPWTPEEESIFIKRYNDLQSSGAAVDWGVFSMEIPGRVGYQCNSFYRNLVGRGVLKDARYEVVDGKAKFNGSLESQLGPTNETPVFKRRRLSVEEKQKREAEKEAKRLEKERLKAERDAEKLRKAAEREEKRRAREAEKARKEEEKKRKAEERERARLQREAEKQRKAQEMNERKRKREEEKQRKAEEKQRKAEELNARKRKREEEKLRKAQELNDRKRRRELEKEQKRKELAEKAEAKERERQEKEEKERLLKEKRAAMMNAFVIKRAPTPTKAPSTPIAPACTPSDDFEALLSQQSLHLEGLAWIARVVKDLKSHHRRWNDRARPCDTQLHRDEESAPQRSTHTSLPARHPCRRVLLKFCDDEYRPAYYGIPNRQRPFASSGRNPFVKDPSIDYDRDSDVECEGELLSDTEMRSDDEGEDMHISNEDGWLVPDGYLSDQEGLERDEADISRNNMEEYHEAPRHLQGVVGKYDPKSSKKRMSDASATSSSKLCRKVLPLKPLFMENAENRWKYLEDTFAAYKAIPIPPTDAFPIGLDAPVVEKNAKHHRSKEFPSELLPLLASHTHLKTCGIDKLVAEFRALEGVPADISKRLVVKTIKSIAVKEKRSGDTRSSWHVEPPHTPSTPTIATPTIATPVEVVERVSAPSPSLPTQSSILVHLMNRGSEPSGAAGAHVARDVIEID